MEAWAPIWENRLLLINGFLLTLLLSVITIATSTALGFAVALLRNARIPVVAQILRVYLEIFRGSPLLIQILFIYFGAAYLRIPGVTAFLAVCIAITLYIGALISEIFRAGIEAVPGGQREAARTLGLSKFDTTVFVVMPQAMRVSLAPLFGQWIALVKYTSFASVIGLTDIVRQGQGIIERFGSPFQVLAVVGALYFIICYPMSLIAKRLERRAVKS